jgi:hypothetical protein
MFSSLVITILYLMLAGWTSWIIADGLLSFGIQESAPQQGAFAAWKLFQVVAPYVFVRSIEKLLLTQSTYDRNAYLASIDETLTKMRARG